MKYSEETDRAASNPGQSSAAAKKERLGRKNLTKLENVQFQGTENAKIFTIQGCKFHHIPGLQDDSSSLWMNREITCELGIQADCSVPRRESS